MADTRSFSRGLNFIIWWKIDPNELIYQTTHYTSLGWTRSARKVSALFLLLTALVTFGFVFFSNQDFTPHGDMLVSLTLAIFAYKGHKWALMAAMIYWTLSKASLIIAGPSTFAVTQLLWWSLYMKAFYLAWKVAGHKRPA